MWGLGPVELSSLIPKLVNLRIKSKNGRKPLTITMDAMTRLEVPFWTFCEFMSTSLEKVSFHFEGSRLRSKQTPAVLFMEDGDVIDAVARDEESWSLPVLGVARDEEVQNIPVIGVDGKRPDFHLRIFGGVYAGSIISIPPISELPGIGRSRKNVICLHNDKMMSCFQAYLAATVDGHVRLCDGCAVTGTRSTNRTHVNGSCIDHRGHRLVCGDVVAMGDTFMMVEPCAAAKDVFVEPPRHPFFQTGTTHAEAESKSTSPAGMQISISDCAECLDQCLQHRLVIMTRFLGCTYWRRGPE